MQDDNFEPAPRWLLIALAAFAGSVVLLVLLLPSLRFGRSDQVEIVRPAPPPIVAEQEQPEQAEEPPRPVVQYAAVALRGAHYSRRPPERVEILQGEGWLREESPTENGGTRVLFSRTNSSVYVTWYRDASGADQGLGASFEEIRPLTAHDSRRSIQRNTGRTETALGERCTVWEADLADEERRRPHTRTTTCITGDGIRLWTRGYDFEGRPHVNSRLLSLQRRSVTPEEAAPPARLFRWETWRGEMEEAPAHNLRIDLASPRKAEGEVSDRESVRERGAWRYVESSEAGSSAQWRITGPNLSFIYSEGSFRNIASRHLGIGRGPTPPQRDHRGPLLEPRRTELIAWRRCDWYELPAPSHSSAQACISADGLTLARISAGDGVMAYGHFSVRATRISRDPLPASALAPPARVFDWLN